jgi:catechol 2,3-dioxygenase-like lactoylglutathione lyase family enzyme
MFDHISLRTHQFDVMTAFYEQALAPLGIKMLMAFEGGQGLGAMRRCCRLTAPSEPSSKHPSGAVDSGQIGHPRVSSCGAQGWGKDNDAPGPRDFAPNYYAAFVIDPDGNNIEAVSRSA